MTSDLDDWDDLDPLDRLEFYPGQSGQLWKFWSGHMETLSDNWDNCDGQSLSQKSSLLFQ